MTTQAITLHEAMAFTWYEADLLDTAQYDEWLGLWTADAHYVVPIEPGATDFESSLNYAFDDHTMREKRVSRLVSGLSISASPVARTIRVQSLLSSPEVGRRYLRIALRPDSHRIPARPGTKLHRRYRVPFGAQRRETEDCQESRSVDQLDRGTDRHRIYLVTGSGTEAVRSAVVTGAGSGLGEAIAHALHGGGYRVMVADIDEAAAQRVAAALDSSGLTAIPQKLDVREKLQFAAGLKAAVDRFGIVHALINNAAATIARPVMEISPEEFDAVVAVNLRGTFLGCQVFGAYFRDREPRPHHQRHLWPRSPARTAARRPAPTTPHQRAASSR